MKVQRLVVGAAAGSTVAARMARGHCTRTVRASRRAPTASSRMSSSTHSQTASPSVYRTAATSTTTSLSTLGARAGGAVPDRAIMAVIGAVAGREAWLPQVTPLAAPARCRVAGQHGATTVVILSHVSAQHERRGVGARAAPGGDVRVERLHNHTLARAQARAVDL